MPSLTSTTKSINVLFNKYSQHETKDGKHYERIPIYVESSCSSCEPLLLKTSKCFSLGAKPNIDKETGEEYGWVLPICLLDKVSTHEQTSFLLALENVIGQVRDKVRQADMQDSFNYSLSEEQIAKIGGCLWRGRDDNDPILYAKIIENKGRASFYNTRLYKDKKVTSKQGVTDPCYVRAIICVDSVLVFEDKAHLKVQVYEASIHDLVPRQSFL